MPNPAERWRHAVQLGPLISEPDGDAHWGGVTPLMSTLYQEPRPFVWFPLAGQRHAIDRRDRNVPIDAPMRCLCGDTHPRRQDADAEWPLWPTCEVCWEETCKIVGLRPRR
jgi:hypothetical protein